MQQIIVIGASETYGMCDPDGGWVRKLRAYIDRKYYEDRMEKTYVFNLSVSGNTTRDLLNRFETEIKNRLRYDKTIFFLSAGLNDSRRYKLHKEKEILPEEFEENLAKLFRLASAYSNRILFMTVHPIDDSKTNPIPWAPDEYYLNKQAKHYVELSKKCCKKSGIFAIDVFSAWEQTNFQRFLFKDGMHANAAGHEYMFNEALKQLTERQWLEYKR